MERLLEVSIDSQNMLREYLVRGAGDNRGWAEDPSGDTDAGENGSEATKTATQAAVKALTTLDVFRSGSNKAALNFEVVSDKESLHLHRFVRVVASSGTKSFLS
jgi:hypothetical protein